MKSVKYLIQLQEEQGLNNAATARKLNMTEAAISHYKTGKRVMDDETCLAVALALGMDEAQAVRVIMAAGIDRAEKAGQKSLWEVFMTRTAATAASLLLAGSVNLFLTPGRAEAAQVKASLPALNSDSLYYVKLLLGNALRRTVSAWLKWMFGETAPRPAAS